MTKLHRLSIRIVRRAIVELRNRELVATLPARGTYVIGAPEATSSEPNDGETA